MIPEPILFFKDTFLPRREPRELQNPGGGSGRGEGNGRGEGSGRKGNSSELPLRITRRTIIFIIILNNKEIKIKLSEPDIN